MYNISVFKMKELYNLCMKVQDIDQGMCKGLQYEVQRKSSIRPGSRQHGALGMIFFGALLA